tara:strand:- start:1270 stop:1449 length:180 start_codon:yes stop_codon:yes gene_type:complete
MTTTPRDVAKDLQAHERECNMFRIGVNARLKRIERVIYGGIFIIIADYFDIFTHLKGIV